MKIFAAILAVLALLALGGCAKKKLRTASIDTQILAVFSAQERLYVIDRENEYEFDSEALKKFYFLKDFIEKTGPFIKRGEAVISVDYDFGGKTRIFFNLTLGGDSDVSPGEYYKLELQKNGDILVVFKDESGKALKLKDREELLRKFSMQSPLPARKIVLSSKRDVGTAVSTALSEAASPIIFPFWVLHGILKNR